MVLNGQPWMTPDDVYRENIPIGKDACIVGGGSVGCETAIYLARKGFSVVVLEMAGEVAADLHEANREMLLDLLRQHSVKVLYRNPGGGDGIRGRDMSDIRRSEKISGGLAGPGRWSPAGPRPDAGDSGSRQRVVRCGRLCGTQKD